MSGRNSGPVCSSSERVRRLEDLQFSLGQGPCQDAYKTGVMVAEPDLANSARSNWPNYTPQALDLGACAVFAFPLRSMGDLMGVLTVYDNKFGMLTSEQAADGSVLAEILPGVMSAIQSKADHPGLAADLSDANAHRDVVHQASGMTAIQLGIHVHDALARVRAHAYSNNQTVAHVASEIVAHRLQLGEDEYNKERPDG